MFETIEMRLSELIRRTEDLKDRFKYDLEKYPDAATDIDIAITSFKGARDIVNKPIEKQEMQWQVSSD